MGRSSAALAATSTRDENLVAWAEMHLADALSDIEALKTSPRIWHHRRGRAPVDVTGIELARLERRVSRLARFIERKRQAMA